MRIAWTPKDFFMNEKRELIDRLVRSVNSQLGSLESRNNPSYWKKKAYLVIDKRVGNAIHKLSEEKRAQLFKRFELMCVEMGWEVEHFLRCGCRVITLKRFGK